MTGRTLAAVVLVLATVPAAVRVRADDAAPSAAPRMTPEWAVREACNAPDRWFLLGADPEDLGASPTFDEDRRRWRVTFRLAKDPVLEVTVDDASGAIVTQHFLGQDPAVRTPGEAVDRVRRDPVIGRYIRNADRFTLVPRFAVARRVWQVTVLDRGERIGVVLVWRGTLQSDGPWTELRGNWLRHAWRELRPALRPRQVLYALAILFVLVTLNIRRVFSLHGLDVLALVLLTPAMLLVSRLPTLGYGALWVLTLYLFVRALTRAGRAAPSADDAPDRWGPVRRWGPRALIAAVLVVLALQGLAAVNGDMGGADDGGLVGGEALFDTGIMPYTAITRDFRTYGPVHFLLYGAAARLFPSGVDWRTFDLDNPDRPVNRTGGRLLVFLFHVLTVVALVGVGRKFTGDVRLGLLVALAYMLLPQTVDKLTHGSRIMPGTYFTLALWAWPNPWLSGLCLGLGTGQWWFPAAAAPLWITSFRRWGRLKFALVLLVLAVFLLGVMMRPPAGQTLGDRWRFVRDATVFCQERFAGHLKYNPTDGFWRELTKHEPPKPGVFHRPVAGRVRVGVMVAYGVFCLVLAVLPRRKGPRQMAALTAAVVIGSQLWKNLHSCEYVGWYAPVLLAALLLPLGSARPRSSDADHTDTGKAGPSGDMG